MGELQVAPRPGALATTDELLARANTYASKRPANTKKAREHDWKHFTAWCAQFGHDPLPASVDTIAAYITYHLDYGGLKVSTVKRYTSTVSVVHDAAGYDSPTRSRHIRELWKGYLLDHGYRPAEARPVLLPIMRAIADTLGDDLIDVRDRALLLVGLAGFLRRSELVALDVEDISATDDGLEGIIRRSKTDQAGEGRKVGIPYGSDPSCCPVRAWRAWLAASGIATGPVFRPIGKWGHLEDARLSDRAVSRILKRRATQAGVDPERLSGHSLRAGGITAARRGGASEEAIMRQSGHRSLPMVRRYIRDGDLWRDNAAAKIGL